jgi:hypothetical protein
MMSGEGMGGGTTMMMLRQQNQQDGRTTGDYEDGANNEADSDDDNSTSHGGVIKYENLIVPHPSKTALFQCNKADIHFETHGIENHTPGFYVRLETIPDKQTGFQKVTKSMKQTSFQFSYDSIHKRFKRELRDKENKDISNDNLYLQMKRIKEQYALKLVEDPAYVVPSKVASLTYMTFLQRYERWVDGGQQGDVMDADEEDDVPSEDDYDEFQEEDNESNQGLNRVSEGQSKRMKGPISGR